MSGTRSIRIWDAPVRLFHWTLAALIAFSWYSAEEQMLNWHLRSGMVILFLLIFRLLWGIFGSSTARFGQFIKGPVGILDYLRGKTSAAIGHNPLGALSVVALLGVTALQVGLGLFAVDNDGLMEGPLSLEVSLDTAEQLTEWHESLFNVLLALIALHVGAIAIYAIRGKPLIAPMITGKAKAPADATEMQPGKWWAALLCLAVAALLTGYIWSKGG